MTSKPHDVHASITKIPSMTQQERRNLRNNAEALLASQRDGAKAREILEALEEFEALNASIVSRVKRQPKTERVGEAVRREPVTEASLTPDEKKKRVIASFDKRVMSAHERSLIQVLLDNPGATCRMLSVAIGKPENFWHLQFGSMCSRRRHDFWEAPSRYRHGGEVYLSILAEYSEADSGVTMRDVAVDAFAELGLRGKQNHESP